MSVINIAENDREIISLPCEKDCWIEICAHSNNIFSLYIIRTNDINSDNEVNVDEINNISYTGNSFEKILIDNVQFILILINENNEAIQIDLTINTIPIKDFSTFGPLSAFH